jgi:exportin-1
MAPPNGTWRDIIAQAGHQPDILKQVDVIRNIQNILSTNCSVCSSLGQPFLSQITLIYLEMLNMYR